MITALKYILLGLFFVALTGAAIVRVRPLDPAVWHSAEAFEAAAANTQAIVLEGKTPSEVAEAFTEVALATPRTEILAGSLQDGFASYVTKTKIWAFPDVSTVKLTEVDGGTEVRVWARQVYGVEDFGVNAERVAAWFEALQAG